MAVVNLALRGTQWLFWVILLALSAYRMSLPIQTYRIYPFPKRKDPHTPMNNFLLTPGGSPHWTLINVIPRSTVVWAESTFVNSYEDDWGYYYYSSGIYVPQYAYMLFAAIWTFLVLIPLTLYTIGKAPSVLGHPIFAFVLEVLTTVFWFSAFIAVAAFTAASYFYGDRGVTVFGVSVAASVFGALEW